MDRETLIKMDPHMLVSVLNLKLRDYYSSLENFCDDLGIEQKEIEEKLNLSGYFYKSDINQFR